MSDQMNFKNLLNVTSSQGSASGVTHSDPQGGRTTDQSGQDHVRANLSAAQVTERGWLTSGTSGLTGSTSSNSADLQRSLANRLRRKTDSDAGSTLYKLTWKERTTPSGLLIFVCGLRCAAHGKDFGSWPTPTTRESKGGYQGGRIRNGKISTDTLDVTAQLTGWTTPSATDGTRGGSGITDGMSGSSLTQLSKMAGWATPNTMDSLPLRSREAMIKMHQTTRKNRSFPCNLREQVSPEMIEAVMEAKGEVLPEPKPMRLTVSGQMLTGSSAEMESGGQLDPQSFPLVDGATARVGRLRAYGNAITAQVAQGLIESYMEVR